MCSSAAAPKGVTASARNPVAQGARAATFPREARLLRGSDYRRILGNRTARFRGHQIEVRYTPSPAGCARLGMTVPRRALRRAVDRNRFKRIVRESFRHQRAELPTVDVLVRPARGVHRLDPEAVREELTRAWARIGSSGSEQ